MEVVIYLDSVFALNSLLDGLLLYFTGYLAGVERKAGRVLAAALLGGIYASAVFIPSLAVLGTLPGKVLCGVALVGVSFGCGERFRRLCFVFFALSCLLAGAVLGCGFLLRTELYCRGAYLLPVRLPLLFGAAGACFAALYIFSRGSLRHRVDGTLTDAVCEISGQPVHLRVLRDTGNTLCDGVTGAPVLVAEAAYLAKLWPDSVRSHLAPDALLHPEQVLEVLAEKGGGDCPPLRLLAYRSVGTASGLLLACTAENARIGAYCVPRLTVALSPTPVSEQKEYEALWGGPVK